MATPTYGEKCHGMARLPLSALSRIVDDAVKSLDRRAESWAEGMTQDCFEDQVFTHSITFAIWFYIYKPSPDLRDHENLGAWIIDVMNLLDTIPRDDCFVNAEPTSVEFTFYTDASDSLVVRVPVHEYWKKTDGKSGEEVFKMFYTEP